MPTEKWRALSPATTAASLPEDLVFSNILPWLSAKSLTKFQVVCRRWQSEIHEPNFRLAQLRRRSSFSSGLAYFDGSCRINFLPIFGSPVGVPNPNFGEGRCCDRVLPIASANGLLCLKVDCTNYYPHNFYAVYNPMTRESHRFDLRRYEPFSIGLAFDPSTFPDRFKLVLAVRTGGAFKFEVYSSHTWQCKMSTQSVNVSTTLSPTKVVFAGGALYWYSIKYVLFFDPEKEIAGFLNPPERNRSGIDDFKEEIGVWDDRVTCTRITCDGIKVWAMVEKEKWEMRHFICMDTVFETSQYLQCEHQSSFSLSCQRILAKNSPNWCWRQKWHFIHPLPYEGGRNIYFTTTWRRDTTRKATEVMILHCDLDAQETKVFEKKNIREREIRAFSYRNSFVTLPALSASTSLASHV